MAYIEKRIAFDHERDSDIIGYIDSMTSHKANQLIRELLRNHMRSQSMSQLDRIESKIDVVIRSINSGTVNYVKQDTVVASDTMNKLADALSNLGV